MCAKAPVNIIFFIPDFSAQSLAIKTLGRLVDTSQHSSQDQIQTYLHKYIAKVLDSQRIYFPKFHDIITNLDISKFSYDYINYQAIILESIRPKLLSILENLSNFKIEYYNILFHDYIHYLLILYKLGVTHVLYNFSLLYTFSPVTSYLVNFHLPYSLKNILESKQTMVKQQLVIIDILFQTLQDKLLKLIILRLLESYILIWVFSRTDRSDQTVIDSVANPDHIQSREEEQGSYLLCLISKN
ncbi:hypothetical protein BDW59DRAFT_177045 [Aspergillus cavernicola]|uniref:Uncharacterized protein n=1 Tax=Aspergillus cavernicola TaxID=176166 RepID=A0ABR4H975_9EURO